MDRRTALKRLGAGGVVAVGASVVASSPAFAYANPSSVVPIDFRLEPNGGNNRVRVIVDANASASCPASAVNVPANQATVVGRSVTITAGAVEAPFSWRVTNTLNEGGGGFILPSGSSVTIATPIDTGSQGAIRKVDPPNSSQTLVAGDTVTVRYDTTLRCTYSDTTTAEVVDSRTLVYTA